MGVIGKAVEAAKSWFQQAGAAKEAQRTQSQKKEANEKPEESTKGGVGATPTKVSDAKEEDAGKWPGDE